MATGAEFPVAGYISGPPMHNGWTVAGEEEKAREYRASLRTEFLGVNWTGPFAPGSGICPWCSAGNIRVAHGGPCPYVKAIEYHPNGTVKRVEFNEG